MLNFKPISISLSPNVQTDDVWLAIKIFIKFLLPRAKRRGQLAELEQKFRQYFNAKYAFSFNSGRSALHTIMRALDIKDGDEVLLQAFTCNAVPNPVLWASGTPVYVDIDESLNIDPQALEKKITAKSRAIVIQNTFGVPAKIDKIFQVAKRHNLIVIEDCAHALGATYNGQKIGTFGDIAFFSFGRDKVISSVWGGVITTNNDRLAKKIGEIYERLPRPSRFWTLTQLLHPALFCIIIPPYYIFGKYLLAFLRIIKGVSLAVSKMERMGERPEMFPARMPDALAELALHQFNKLERYNGHRREMAQLYFRKFKEFKDRFVYNSRDRGNSVHEQSKLPPEIADAIYLRFNILHPNAKAIIKNAKRHHILLGDWYKNIIDPIGTDFEKMKYAPGSCPNAERAARESINLPTHINVSKKDAERIIQYFRNYR